jgi:hypothetical protein
MPITIVGTPQTAVNFQTSSGLSYSAESGSDRMLILALGSEGSTDPTAFGYGGINSTGLSYAEYFNSSTARAMQAYWNEAAIVSAGTPPKDFSTTGGSASYVHGLALTAAGVDQASPIKYEEQLNRDNTSTDMVFTGTTCAAGDLIVLVVVSHSGSGGSTCSGYVEMYEINSGAVTYTLTIYRKISAGGTEAPTVVNSSARSAVGRMVVYRAATTAVPTITDAGDETFFNGEAGVTITGTNFGASQGTGVVKISPTDNVNDPAAVLQTPTTWGDTSIQFTALQGYIAANATCYLFVSKDGGQTNTAGYPVMFKYRGPMVPTTLLRPSNATASGTGTVA